MADQRKNNSRPALSKEEKKIPVTIYEKPRDIDLLGGRKKVQENLRTLFNEMLDSAEQQVDE